MYNKEKWGAGSRRWQTLNTVLGLRRSRSFACKFYCRLFFNIFPFPLTTVKLIRDFLNNRVDYAQRAFTESRKAETGKLEWPESQNDRKARMTGKSGTTGMIPESINYSNNALCTNRWGGPKYNLLIILSWFFFVRHALELDCPDLYIVRNQAKYYHMKLDFL